MSAVAQRLLDCARRVAKSCVTQQLDFSSVQVSALICAGFPSLSRHAGCKRLRAAQLRSGCPQL